MGVEFWDLGKSRGFYLNRWGGIDYRNYWRSGCYFFDRWLDGYDGFFYWRLWVKLGLGLRFNLRCFFFHLHWWFNWRNGFLYW